MSDENNEINDGLSTDDDSLDRLLDRAEEDFEDIDEEEEGDEDAEQASASSTVEEYASEEDIARSMLKDMPNPHGSIIEGANGGEGTTVRAAYLGKEMQTSFLEYSMSVIVSRTSGSARWPEACPPACPFHQIGRAHV